MRIAAVGDVHCTTASKGVLEPLFTAMSRAGDVIVLAGDLTDSGLPDEAQVLVSELRVASGTPVIAVLGNHDFESGAQDQVRTIVESAGVKVLDGSSHVHEAVAEALKLESALARLRTPVRVAVLHYAPIRETVEGEPSEIFAFLGSSRLEEPLDRYSVAVTVHGHAHHGSPEGRTRRGAPVYNVCLPLLRAASPAAPPFRLIDLGDIPPAPPGNGHTTVGGVAAEPTGP
jgi:Icc-related predicted phosphoesterase